VPSGEPDVLAAGVAARRSHVSGHRRRGGPM